MIEKYYELKKRLRWWLIWKLIGRSIRGEVLRQANAWYDRETDSWEKHSNFVLKWTYCPLSEELHDTKNALLSHIKLRAKADFTGNIINFEIPFSEQKK